MLDLRNFGAIDFSIADCPLMNENLNALLLSYRDDAIILHDLGFSLKNVSLLWNTTSVVVQQVLRGSSIYFFVFFVSLPPAFFPFHYTLICSIFQTLDSTS